MKKTQIDEAGLSRRAIVFAGVSEPVAAGYAESFARPGSNITGFVFFEPAMVGKWLGVLTEIAPALSALSQPNNA